MIDERNKSCMAKESEYRRSKPHQDVQHYVQGEDVQSDLLFATNTEETLAVEDLVIMTKAKYDELVAQAEK